MIALGLRNRILPFKTTHHCFTTYDQQIQSNVSVYLSSKNKNRLNNFLLTEAEYLFLKRKSGTEHTVPSEKVYRTLEGLESGLCK